MTSALENLAGANGPLAAEPPDEKEIAGWLKSANVRLREQKAKEWRWVSCAMRMPAIPKPSIARKELEATGS